MAAVGSVVAQQAEAAAEYSYTLGMCTAHPVRARLPVRCPLATTSRLALSVSVSASASVYLHLYLYFYVSVSVCLSAFLSIRLRLFMCFSCCIFRVLSVTCKR